MRRKVSLLRLSHQVSSQADFTTVSYDINKDGYRIATLTLVKSAYRLGDTVNAMISLNGGAARVLRVYTATALH